jgi:hypothetical protein
MLVALGSICAKMHHHGVRNGRNASMAGVLKIPISL